MAGTTPTTASLISSLGGNSDQYFTPDTFAQTYGDAASYAADKLGVDPSIVLGHWAEETGYGKSVVPGSNNLGNIKDPSGKGPTAVDNQTGSTDSYQSFGDPMQFAKNYVGLIQNKYPKAVNAGDDANAYFGALKSGGYAQDKNYVQKTTAVTNAIRNSQNLLSKAGNAVASAFSSNANAAEAPQGGQPSTQDLIGSMQDNSQKGATPSSADLIASLGSPAPQQDVPSPITGSPTIDNGLRAIGNVATNVWDHTTHAAKHPIDTATGAAAGLWNPMLGAFSGAGLIEASQDPNSGITVTPQSLAAAKQAAQQYNITPGAGTDQKAFDAGKTLSQIGAATAVGALAPEIPLAEGAGLLTRMGVSAANNAVQGGIQGGVTSALNGDSLSDIGKNTLYGTAGGAVLGPAGTLAGTAVKPIIKAATGVGKKLASVDDAVANAGLATGGKLSDAEQAMAGKVAEAVGPNAQAVAGDLSANAKSAVPGYQRTAAEATDNPTIQALQKGLDNSTDNSGLVARNNVNAAANTNFVSDGAPTDASIQAQKDAFQQSQDALAAQGNAQMGPVTQAQDQGVFNTPAMQRNLGRANTVAQNDGDQAIQHAFDQPNNDLVTQWHGVAGSPQQTANLELLRQTTTSPQYENVLNAAKPVAVDGGIQSLLNKPAMQRAMKAVETYKLNAGDNTPFIQDVAARGPKGELYAQSISPQDLNLAKMHLDDYIQRMGNPSDVASADKFQRNAFIGIRNDINNTLENHVPGFANVNKQYAQLSDQMAASQFLTSPQMVDAFGNLNVRELDSLVKRIQAGKANNNDFDPAKSVSNAKLAQLMQMRDDAVKMLNRNNATGLHGDSYNYMRQAAAKDPIAAQQLQDHLTANSSAYKQFYNDQPAGEQAIAQAQAHRDLINNIESKADGNVSWNDVKHLNTTSGDYEPFTAAKLNAVRDNLQRFNNRAEQVSNSATATNFAKRQGFEDFVQAERGKGLGNAIMSEGGQRVVRTLLGPLGTLAGAHSGGHLGAYVGDYVADKLSTGAAKTLGKWLGGETEEQLAAKTAANRQALEGLLLHPQRLSHAMAAVDKGDAAKKEIVQGLLNRVGVAQKAGGLLGAIAAGQAASNSNEDKRK
ncbi:glucosaminidase domain-containing protein [Caballeronia zhejiangensis]|uniref:glucosaminidase domain-containing protein n=1 Tax=Caballeronia zhejiangensis TaxID=871203 RepID=UPI001F517DDE|nr:glucosaminidase domain-containing protein [Caballeronia zhejiangensis]MCI1046918.1 glucosaminidase domain-containing protein [Caballeronia zhejiangensis]